MAALCGTAADLEQACTLAPYYRAEHTLA